MLRSAQHDSLEVMRKAMSSVIAWTLGGRNRLPPPDRPLVIASLLLSRRGNLLRGDAIGRIDFPFWAEPAIYLLTF
jgi:hypothetical protein